MACLEQIEAQEESDEDDDHDEMPVQELNTPVISPHPDRVMTRNAAGQLVSGTGAARQPAKARARVPQRRRQVLATGFHALALLIDAHVPQR